MGTEQSSRLSATLLWRRWIRLYRQVVGGPDYQAYLEHCRRARHPPELTEREYVREFFEHKGKAPRCC